MKADGDLKVTTRVATTPSERWVIDQYSGPCPIRQLLDRIGDTWTVLVILKLGKQPLRFRQLLKAVEGISQRMLTVTLRALERDGMVLRTVFETKPPSVEYRLTSLGSSLLEPITSLTHWALVNEQAIAVAREKFEKDVNKRSHEAMQKRS